MDPLAQEMVGEGVRCKTLYNAGMGEKENGSGFDAKHDSKTTWQYGRPSFKKSQCDIILKKLDMVINSISV